MTELFRLNGAVKRHASVAAYFAATDPLRLMAQPWFAAMRACGPDVRELLQDGCPVACVEDAAFGYVKAFKAHANVGFFRGAALPDPAHLLEGEGKAMRHVKLRPGKSLDETALNVLITAAYDDIRKQLEVA